MDRNKDFFFPLQSHRRASDLHNYSIICCHLLKNHSLNFVWRQENGDIVILSFLLVSAPCQSQRKSIVCKFRLVESENVESEYLNNMGLLHPSDSISLPFKSVVVYGNCYHAQHWLLDFTAAWGRNSYSTRTTGACAIHSGANPWYTGCAKSTWFNKTCSCCSNMNRHRLVPRGWTDRSHILSACFRCALLYRCSVT